MLLLAWGGTRGSAHLEVTSALRSARLPVNLIGSPINYANRFIGSPITSQSTGGHAGRGWGFPCICAHLSWRWSSGGGVYHGSPAPRSCASSGRARSGLLPPTRGQYARHQSTCTDTRGTVFHLTLHFDRLTGQFCRLLERLAGHYIEHWRGTVLCESLRGVAAKRRISWVSAPQTRGSCGAVIVFRT